MSEIDIDRLKQNETDRYEQTEIGECVLFV